MPVTIDGSLGITTPMYNGSITANAVTPSVNMKNRIINGGMVLSQRNGTSAVTIDGGASYTLDRYLCQDNTDGSYTVAQSSVAPAGFNNSLLVTITGTDSSLTTTQFGRIVQRIEGLNVGDLAWGTASAQTVTLSFWVRSSVTGTFSGTLVNDSGNRVYAFTYTINSANTFEYKTITIAGDTSGTWLTTNGTGIELNLSIGAGPDRSVTAGSWGTSLAYAATGQTNLFATNGATFYLTGCQLEVGSTATSFDYRPYGTELALCQRYCQVSKGSDGLANNYVRIGYGPCQTSTAGIVEYKPLVTFRTQPTLTTSGNFAVYDGVTVTATTGVSIDSATTPYNVVIGWAVSGGGMTTTRGYEYIINNSSTASLTLSAEL